MGLSHRGFAGLQRIEVFCFFFSKKKTLLPCFADRDADAIAPRPLNPRLLDDGRPAAPSRSVARRAARSVAAGGGDRGGGGGDGDGGVRGAWLCAGEAAAAGIRGHAADRERGGGGGPDLSADGSGYAADDGAAGGYDAAGGADRQHAPGGGGTAAAALLCGAGVAGARQRDRAGSAGGAGGDRADRA